MSGSYLWAATVSADVTAPTTEQMAFIQGMSAAPQLPFVQRRAAKSLTNTTAPMNNFGRYENRNVEGGGPTPRSLSKGIGNTAIEYTMHASTVIGQRAQIALAMAQGGLMGVLASLGRGYGWSEHQHIADLLFNDAYTDNFGSFGVPFYSASQPKHGTSALRSNRLSSAFDMTAVKTAFTMLDEMQGYDGEYNSQVGKYLWAPSSAAPDTIELLNSLTRVSSGTQSLDANGFGYSGAAFIGGTGAVPLSSPALEDADAWVLFGSEFLLEVLWVAQTRPKLEVLQGTEDVIISDNPIVQLLVHDHCAAIGGGPA